MSRFKEKWGLKSNLQVILILIVFSINGSFAAWVARPATEFIGLDADTTSPWLFWPVRIILVFVIYQTTLPLVGFLFGQFEFFWKFTKMMVCRLGLGFVFKKSG